MDSRAKTEHAKDAASAVCLWHTSSRGRRQAKVCSREAGRNLRRGPLSGLGRGRRFRTATSVARRRRSPRSATRRPQLGRPWEPHYIYTGAFLIVLIVAESLRGARFTRTALVLAFVLAVVALVGNIRAFDGGEADLRAASTTVKAELGALQLIRATASPTLVLDPQWAPQIQPAPYFAFLAGS
jgi:hypothetical protein